MLAKVIITTKPNEISVEFWKSTNRAGFECRLLKEPNPRTRTRFV